MEDAILKIYDKQFISPPIHISKRILFDSLFLFFESLIGTSLW